jgi:NTP pyrophosphatase (non-canonical NTP hydrolase)
VAEPVAGRAAAPRSIEELQARLRAFAHARDWEQFHTPKNLAMALVAEAGELVEQFQWLTAQESAELGAEKLAAVRHELADVLIYLARLADIIGVDLLAAAGEKMALNEARYPVDRVRGSARKHDE